MLQSLSEQVQRFERLFDSDLTTVEQVNLLQELSDGKMSAAELVSCARYLRSKMNSVFVPCSRQVVDIVRCGGGAHATFNIAIVAAFITAGAGVHVAKHCIRCLDHDGGIMAVLNALNIELKQDPKEAAAQLNSYGLSFLVAENFHPILSRVKKAQQIFTKTNPSSFLNRVLPLCNPCDITRMSIGVSDPACMHEYIEALRLLGVEEAYVFSSSGVDAVTNLQDTEYHYFDQGLSQGSSWPKGLRGMQTGSLEDLVVSGVANNAITIEAILERVELGAKRNVALMNAAVAISLGYPERLSFVEALGMAQESLDSGAALMCLRGLQCQ